jgi:uncharacterized damage-inducible protein DinB
VNYEDLSTLLDYHYWARDRILDALEPLTTEQFTRPMNSSFPSIRGTIVHVFAAELLWYSRWRGNSPKALLPGDTIADVALLRSRWRDLEQDVRHLVEELGPEGIGHSLDYHSMSGQPDSSVFWHMLQHVINHATYHRGQVTTMLRQIGVAPAKSMDLIAFYRERKSTLTKQQSA